MKEKRSVTDNSYLTSNVLLELEGICIQNNFIEEHVIYVQQHVEEYINKNWESESFQEVVQILREEAKLFEQQTLEGFVGIPEGDNDKTKKAVLDNILWQMESNQNSDGFKKVKDGICQDGYKSGNLKTKLCEDFDTCLRNWNAEGKKIYIISSLKVDEQKLILANTEKGDFLPVISGYFDEETGPKNTKNTYSKILEKIGCISNDLMFISDKFESVLAASTSGLVTLLLSKDSSVDQGSSIALVNSISNIEFHSSNKKRKICNESIQFSESHSVQELKPTTSNDLQIIDHSEKNIEVTGEGNLKMEIEQNITTEKSNGVENKSNNSELDRPQQIDSDVQSQYPIEDIELNSNTKKRKICNEPKESSLPHSVQEPASLNLDFKDDSGKNMNEIYEKNHFESKIELQNKIINTELRNGDTVLPEDNKDSISDNEFHSSIKRPKICDESTESSSLHAQELQSTSSSGIENVDVSEKKFIKQGNDGIGKSGENTGNSIVIDSNGISQNSVSDVEISQNSVSDVEMKSDIQDKNMLNETTELSQYNVKKLQTNSADDVEIMAVSETELAEQGKNHLKIETVQGDENEKSSGVGNENTSDAEVIVSNDVQQNSIPDTEFKSSTTDQTNCNESVNVSPLVEEGKCNSSDDTENVDVSDEPLTKQGKDNLEIEFKKGDAKEKFNEVDSKSTSDSENVVVSSGHRQNVKPDTEFKSSTTNQQNFTETSELSSLQTAQKVHSSTIDDPENKDVSEMKLTKQDENRLEIKTGQSDENEKSSGVGNENSSDAKVIVSNDVERNSIPDTEFKSSTTDQNNFNESVDVSPFTVQGTKSKISDDPENMDVSETKLTKQGKNDLEIKTGESDLCEKPSGVENESIGDSEIIVSNEVTANSIPDAEFKSSATEQKNFNESVDVSPHTVVEPKTKNSGNPENMDVSEMKLTKQSEDHMEIETGKSDENEKSSDVGNKCFDDAETNEVRQYSVSDTECKSSINCNESEDVSPLTVKGPKPRNLDGVEDMDVSEMESTKQGENHLQIKTDQGDITKKSNGVENPSIGDSVGNNSNEHNPSSISVPLNSNTDNKKDDKSTEILPNVAEELKTLSSDDVETMDVSEIRLMKRSDDHLEIELGQGDNKEKSSGIETNTSNAVFGNGDVAEIDAKEHIHNSNSNSKYNQLEMTPAAIETNGIKHISVDNLIKDDKNQMILDKNVDVEERATTSNEVELSSDKLLDENVIKTDLETLTEGIKKTENNTEKLDVDTKNSCDSISIMSQNECSEIIENSKAPQNVDKPIEEMNHSKSKGTDCSSEVKEDTIPEKPELVSATEDKVNLEINNHSSLE